MSGNVLSGREAKLILAAIDAEQLLPEDLRERLTRLQDGYNRRRVEAIKRHAEEHEGYIPGSSELPE